MTSSYLSLFFVIMKKHTKITDAIQRHVIGKLKIILKVLVLYSKNKT